MSDPTDAPATPDAPDRSWLPWLVTGILGVTLVALVVASVLVWRAAQPREDDDGAVGVAKEAVRNFNGLDYRDPDEGVERVLDMATGDFEDEYEELSEELVQNLVDKKLTLSADIPGNGAALEYLSEDEAQVLVAVNVTTTSAEGVSETRLQRARVVLTWEDDQWLVSDLQDVG
jgi:Mce-associated membrane protein